MYFYIENTGENTKFKLYNYSYLLIVFMIKIRRV